MKNFFVGSRKQKRRKYFGIFSNCNGNVGFKRRQISLMMPKLYGAELRRVWAGRPVHSQMLKPGVNGLVLNRYCFDGGERACVAGRRAAPRVRDKPGRRRRRRAALWYQSVTRIFQFELKRWRHGGPSRFETAWQRHGRTLFDHILAHGNRVGRCGQHASYLRTLHIVGTVFMLGTLPVAEPVDSAAWIHSLLIQFAFIHNFFCFLLFPQLCNFIIAWQTIKCLIISQQ